MNLFISPITIELLEAAFRARCHLIPSTGQVGPKGYAFTDEGFFAARWKLEISYTWRPYVERDHLGKGGEDHREWLDRDFEFGFHGAMIHTNDYDLVAGLAEDYPSLYWQVGGGEDDKVQWTTLRYPRNTRWVSRPTGCLIDRIGNKDAFQAPMPYGNVQFRAHNCDYLSPQRLKEISLVCGGINVAPGLGTLQSCYYLQVGVANGYPVQEWLDACHDSPRAKQWGDPLAAGHYHYDLLPWRSRFQDHCTIYLAKVLVCMKNGKSVGGPRL